MFTYHEHGYPVQITKNILENFERNSNKSSQHLMLYTQFTQTLQGEIESIPNDFYALKEKIYASDFKETKKLIGDFESSVERINSCLSKFGLLGFSINDDLFSHLSDLDEFYTTKNEYVASSTKVLKKLNLPIDFKIDWDCLVERLKWAMTLSQRITTKKSLAP